VLNERASHVVAGFHEWADKHDFLIEKVWLRAMVPGGDWPNADELTRWFFARGRRVDVAAVARAMPPALGRLDDGQVVLTVRGASYYGGAKRDLRRYVKSVALAIERYRDPHASPVITDLDLKELGLGSSAGQQTFARILQGETWALQQRAAVDGAPREYVLSVPAALVLGRVSTLPKYLEAQANAWWPDDGGPASPPLLLEPPAATLPAASTSASVDAPLTLDASLKWLHPALTDACSSLLAGGHHREAVQRGAAVLQDEIRRLSRSKLDGDALMSVAFSPTKPRIAVVPNRRTASGQSIQRGTHLLAMGVIAAIRNPSAHGTVEFSYAEAVECLAMMSFIYRRLDAVSERRSTARQRRSSQ